MKLRSQKVKEKEDKAQIASIEAPSISQPSSPPVPSAQARADSPPSSPDRPLASTSNHGSIDPPPPSLDASSPSSSSKLVASSPPSQEISTSPLGPNLPSTLQILAIVEHLSSTVDRLSSENRAQQAQIDLLSSENEELRRRDEGNTRTIAKMSVTLSSDVHWIFEPGGGQGEGEGRWTTTLGSPATHNTPKVTLSPFETLPLEVFQRLSLLITHGEFLALFGLSFSTLRAVARVLYPVPLSMPLHVPSDRMAQFILSRASSDQVSERITPLLLPSILLLHPQGFLPSHLEPLQNLPSLDRPVRLLGFSFYASPGTPFPLALTQWSPILHLFDPLTIFFCERWGAAASEPPSSFVVDGNDLPFLDSWTRLLQLKSHGPRSVPVLEGTEGKLAFAQCLLSGLTDEAASGWSFASGSWEEQEQEQEQSFAEEGSLERSFASVSKPYELLFHLQISGKLKMAGRDVLRFVEAVGVDLDAVGPDLLRYWEELGVIAEDFAQSKKEFKREEEEDEETTNDGR